VDTNGKEHRRKLRWNRRTLMNCEVIKNKGGKKEERKEGRLRTRVGR
jgi:hypothetical protein